MKVVTASSANTQPMVFMMSPLETERARYWIAQHRHRAESLRIVTYSFTETGIGRKVSVRCACGAEFDVTDYNHW
jgi:hypothetical protein